MLRFALAAAVSLIISSVWVPRADACSGVPTRPTVIHPDNLTIAPTAFLMLNVTPFGPTGPIEVEEIPRSGPPRRAAIESATLRFVGFSNLLLVRPAAQWNAASRYTIQVDEPDQRVEIGAFQVNRDVRILPVADPTRITWFDQYFEERRGDTCVGVITRSYRVDLSFADVQPEFSYVQLEVRGRNKDGQPATQDVVVMASNAVEMTIEEGLFEYGFEPECVEAWVVGLDGRKSESIETCVPEKCALLPKEAPRDSVDWSQFDGCTLECTLGELGYTCTEDGKQVDPQNPGGAPRRASLDDDEFTPGRGCACSAEREKAAGSGSPAWLAVLALWILRYGGIIVRRN